MSTCPRFLYARTESRHKESDHIQASASASKQLNTALKTEALCITINRKVETLPRFTQQDIKEVPERATDIQKVERLDQLDASDVEQRAHLPCLVDFLEQCKHAWHTFDAETVNDHPARPGHKLSKRHASEKGYGSCHLRV